MYFVYMLKCENGSIYTGMTSDVERRFKEHTDTKKNRKGAKYTRAFKPLSIAAVFSVRDRSKAMSLEAKIKNLDREKKLFIIDIYNTEHEKNLKKQYVTVSKIKDFIL